MTHRSAIAIRHVAFEDLGLLAPVLEKSGFDVSYREASIDDLADPAIAAADLLIVLGGPIGVYEVDAYPFLAKEIAALERRLAKDLPTLGVCLGCQLMAKALGARVFAGPVKEIGWGALDLTLQGLQSCLAPLADRAARVLHWHGDTFDLPHDAVRLAGNVNYDNQAFSHGRHGLGLQFHIEAEPRRLEEWYVGHTVELGSTGQSVAQLRAATAALSAGTHKRAVRIFTAWLTEIDQAQKI
jgi:GMP synthase (glutamine-hydrolysing)